MPTTGITVFVGPNNSGKSLVLREIESSLSHNAGGLQILRDYEISWPNLDTLKTSLAKFEHLKPQGIADGNMVIGRINPTGSLETVTIAEQTFYQVAGQQTQKQWWAQHYLRWGILRLDGRSRFNLTNDQPAGDLLAAPVNVLTHLFQDDAARQKVRALISDAFGLNFVVDPTQLGQLRIRLSREDPLTDEQSLNEAARLFYRRALHVKEASDGVQAFCGIVTAVMSGEFHTLLIDEPEAFLHPPLARKLGKHLATLATERGGVLMASTHSPDFVMGCVHATNDVRVVRLEYSEGKSRGRMVDAAQLANFFRRPLMRSANVVSALFHDGVVVTESDNDRAFYSEIYYRLAEGTGGFPSILFINAQNKQTIKDIIGPLRQFGVPAIAITDIDVVKDGGRTWLDWLDAANVPEALHQGYQAQRAQILQRLVASGKDMKTEGGIDILGPSDKLAAQQLFDVLAEHGVFVVPRGELENWLPELGIPGKKTDWTVAMMDRLGSDPSDMSYVRPQDGDVWEFMRKVVAWVRNPARKGTC